MKFYVPTDGLLEGLNYVSMLTKKRTTKPILSCVRMVILPDSLHLEGTDLETTFRWVVPGIQSEAIQSGPDIIVDSERFLKMIKSMKKEEYITLETELNKLYIQGGKKKFALLTEYPDEFPILPNTIINDSIDISGRELGYKIDKTSFAVSKEGSAYALNGLYFELDPENRDLSVVATDGKRLAIAGDLVEYQGFAKEPFPPSTIPMDTIKILMKILSKHKEETVYIDSLKRIEKYTEKEVEKERKIVYAIRFTVPGLFEISSRILEGDFPKVRDVVNPLSKMPMEIIFDKKALIMAIETCCITAGHDIRSVNLNLTDNHHMVFSSMMEGIGESRIEIEVLHSELPIVFKPGNPEGVYSNKYWLEETLTLNPDFILDYIKRLEGDSVNFFASDVKSSIRLEDATDGDSFYVLMPICDN